MAAPPVDPMPCPAVRTRPRWWVGLGLLAAVICLHGWLIDGLLPGRASRQGVGEAAGPRVLGAVQVRTVAQAQTPLPTPAEPVPAPNPMTATAPVAAVTEQMARTGAATAQPVPERSLAPPARAPALPASAADAGDPELAWRAARAGVATQDTSAPDASNAGAGRPDAPAGEPPPVYATRLPAPTLLTYRLRRGAQTGEVALAWWHDGQRFQLQFDARLGGAGRGPPLIEQFSQGGFDEAGLAPDRFTDRRRGRGQRAVNFRRDIGRISFSGPTVDYPAWPGAQDRLSWLVQMVAIQAGSVGTLPLVKLFVVDAGGGAELWRFELRGEALVDTPRGPSSTRHWLREPDRPEGQRVELWLDPGLGHWPVRMRTTLLRSGEVLEWWLLAEPAVPP